MSKLLIDELNRYKIGARLGFCVPDNAGDNDTSLRVVLQP